MNRLTRCFLVATIALLAAIWAVPAQADCTSYICDDCLSRIIAGEEVAECRLVSGNGYCACFSGPAAGGGGYYCIAGGGTCTWDGWEDPPPV